MTKENGKPQIRFAKFKDTWEQRKLEDYIVEYHEVTTENNQYPALTSSRKGIFLQTEYFAGNQIASEDNTGYNVVPYGYFTYRHMSDDEIFHFNINDIVENGIVSTLYPVFTTTNKLDSRYLQYQLNHGHEFARFAVLQKQGGSRTYMYISKLKQLSLTMPKSVDEQKQISGFFMKLDHLITLHQRKYDKLTKVKKSMLEKMFPKNGTNVPEIRFKGFTDAWEQRKVTELGEIYIGLVTTMTEHYTDQGHLLIRNSDIKDGYFEFGENPIYLDEEFSKQNKSRMHQLGDVITVHTGDIGTSAVIGKNEVNSIGFATIVTRPNQEILDSGYFATYLNTDTHKQWAISIATGDGRSNYNLKDYTKLMVPIPQIEEQKKIAACIGNLNNLITLHQRKLEKLKILKKACLEKMFV